MDKTDYNKYKEWITKIGAEIRRLRKNNTNLNYIDFSKKINMNKNTYFRIEAAKGDYSISKLCKIIDYYPHIKMSDFFENIKL